MARYDTTRRNGGRARHPGESADSSPSLYCADPWHAVGCASGALARVGQVLSTGDAEPVSHAERALQTRGRCGGATPAVAAARNRRHVAAWLCAGWTSGSALARGRRTIASLGRPAVELDVDGELARRLASSRTRGKRYSAVAATCARRRSANRGLVARLQWSGGIQATTRMRRGAVADRAARRGECEPGPSFVELAAGGTGTKSAHRLVARCRHAGGAAAFWLGVQKGRCQSPGRIDGGRINTTGTPGT